MPCAPATKTFAYIAAGYLIASVVYLITTACVGTPFSDSLTEEQRAIQKDSAGLRKRCFCAGAAVATLILLAWRPFRD